MPGLFLEFVNAPVRIRGDDAKTRGLLQRHGQGGDGDVRLPLQVKADHLVYVHAVDVVGSEHQDQLRMLILDQVEVLADRVRGALEPAMSLQHLGGHHGDELVRKQGRDGPGVADVLDQRLGLVLHQQINREDPGVDQVAEHEVHDPVARPEGHRRLGALVGERMQP